MSDDNGQIDLRNMTLFQSERVSACTDVRRVPGGYIYQTIIESSADLAVSSVFVPTEIDHEIGGQLFTPYTGVDS